MQCSTVSLDSFTFLRNFFFKISHNVCRCRKFSLFIYSWRKIICFHHEVKDQIFDSPKTYIYYIWLSLLSLLLTLIMIYIRKWCHALGFLITLLYSYFHQNIILHISIYQLVRGRCSIENGGCQQICNEASNLHHCSCFSGFQLNNDGKTCSPGQLKSLVVSVFRQTLEHLI